MTSNPKKLPHGNLSQGVPIYYYPQEILIDENGESHVLPPTTATSTSPQPRPRPMPCPPQPSTSEKFKGSVPDSMGHQQGKEERTEECSVDELGANTFNQFRALGSTIGTMYSSLKCKLKRAAQVELELRAMNEALLVQLKEAQDESELAKAKSEEIVSKAEKEVKEAKSEEAIWRNNYITLSKQLDELEIKSKEKDQVIDKGTKDFKELEKRVLDWETSEKKEIEEKNKQIEELKINFEKLEKTIAENSGENSRILQELGNLRFENQVKNLKLEEKNQTIQRLVTEVVDLRKNDAVLQRIDRELNEFRRKRSLSSSSSENETDEPSLVAMDEDNGNDDNSTGNETAVLDGQEDSGDGTPTAATSVGIRTDSGRNSRKENKKKRLEKVECPAGDDVQPEQQILPIILTKNPFTGKDDNDKPEGSASSMASCSSSSRGKRQRKKRNSKK